MTHFLYKYFLTRKSVANESKLSKWLHWQLFKYLKFTLIKYYKHISVKTLGTDSSSNMIVSCTSFPARIGLVHLTLKSVLNQTYKPQKIVLWLATSQFPNGEEALPKSLLELRSLGLQIEFCEDIKAHKKYFFAFQKYRDNLVVTVDDDVIYPVNLLKTLMETHKKYPNSVVANRVRLMEIHNNQLVPYRSWKINKVGKENPSKNIFSTGVGGVLYQPSMFPESMFSIEGIKQTNCMNDDIWLKASQMVSNLPVAFTDYYLKQFIEIPDSQAESLFSYNVFENDNDRQIIEIFKYFGIRMESFH